MELRCQGAVRAREETEAAMGAAHRGDSIQGNVSATVEKPNEQKRDAKAREETHEVFGV